WFRYWPPRMVSAKWTFQLSRSSTLAMAAAMPPSAMTVCALPSSDLHTTPTETPIAEASIAARRPAPPAPMTSTSCSWVSNFVSLMVVTTSEDADIGDRAGGHLADVEIRERHAEERDPGECHVVDVDSRDP